MKRFGGMVAFRVKGGEDVATKVCAETQLWILGESLGGVESLIEHPGRMTHASVAGTELEVPVRPDPPVRRHRGRRGPRRRPRPGARPAHLTGVPRALRSSASTSARPSPRRCSSTSPRAPCSARRATRRRSRPTSWTAWMPCAPALAGHGEPDDVLVCSSAGGGLRLAVVGYEREVTAEAGHRVGLSAGAKVVHVACGPMTGADVAALRAACPDLVLLVGGTDGGNAEVLLHNAERHREGAPLRTRRGRRQRRRARRGRRPAGVDRAAPRVTATTCCRGSGSSHPRRRGPPSARRSSPTSSAARGSRAAAGSPSWCAPPPRMPCCAAWRCSPTSWAATCSSSTSVGRRPTSTR